MSAGRDGGTVALAFDVASLVTRSPSTGAAAEGALAIGMAAVVPTASTGVADWRVLIG